MQAPTMSLASALGTDARGMLAAGLRYFLVGMLLLLGGCGSHVELFSVATDGAANEVLSVLLDVGIPAQKTATKAGVVVSVDENLVARALDILRARGLPRENFVGMGQIFRKEGLVSSPLEERARYIYALSQELANTLSQMDGVLTARVHVVLPARGEMGEKATPSTAGVFIKHQTGYSLDAMLPQMRKLVTHAIPGLTEDRVSITLAPAQPAAVQATVCTTRQVLGIEVAEGSVNRLRWWLMMPIVLVLTLAAVLGVVVRRHGLLNRDAAVCPQPDARE